MFKLIDQYILSKTNLDSSDLLWDQSWKRQSSGSGKFITFGRQIYNYYLFNFLKKYLEPDLDFLEVGCGTASLGQEIVKSVGSYTGYDISQQAIEQAKKEYRDQNIIKAGFYLEDITRPTQHKEYDLVWSQGLVEHFADTSSMIEAHLNVCKSGGRVIISVPAKFSYHYLWYLLTRNKKLKKFWPWPDQIFISKEDFVQALKKLTGKYKSYRITCVKPRILGLQILIINKQS